MTEKLKKSKSVVTRLEETWPGSGTDARDLVVAEVKRGISRMSLPRHWTPAELQERKLIYVSMREREVLNAYRQLRTQLMQKRPYDNMAIMVVSPGDDGHSAAQNAINLAAAFALDPQKTALYIDCNPYQPSAHRYLLRPPKYGVTDYLDKSNIPLERIIYPTGVERLRVIPVGRSCQSAVEHFHSGRMHSLISELKQRYNDRFIIVNAAPVKTSSEAQILSLYCDMTVLAASYGSVTSTDINNAYQAIDSRRIAGMIYSYL